MEEKKNTKLALEIITRGSQINTININHSHNYISMEAGKDIDRKGKGRKSFDFTNRGRDSAHGRTNIFTISTIIHIKTDRKYHRCKVLALFDKQG